MGLLIRIVYDNVDGTTLTNLNLGGHTVLIFDFQQYGEAVGKIYTPEGGEIVIYEGPGAKAYMHDFFAALINAIHTLENKADLDLTDFGDYGEEEEGDDEDGG